MEPNDSPELTTQAIVLLEFAKVLTAHYSKEYELLSKHYPAIMKEAHCMTNAYFDRLELLEPDRSELLE